MALIGIIGNKKNQEEREYIDSLKMQNIEIISLTEENYTHYLSSVDAVVLQEPRFSEISRICEWIIVFKELSSAYICVLANQSSDKKSKMIYLHLGITHYVDETQTAEEFSLILRNSLQRREMLLGRGNSKTEKEMTAIQLFPRNSSISIRNGEEIDLTKLEFRAMSLLKKNPGIALSYKEIHKELWGEEEERRARTANLFFCLRKKIERDVKNPHYIKTIRSKGYLLNE